MRTRKRATRRGKRDDSPLFRKLSRLLAFSLTASSPLAGASCAGALLSCRGSDPARDDNDAASPARDASRDATVAAEAGDDASACAPVRMEAGLFGEDGSCGQFIYLPCGVPVESRGVGCDPSPDFCASVCPQGFFFICNFPAPTCEDGGVAPDAAFYLDCTTCLGNVGRRPVGLRPPARRVHATALGQYFARAAYMERASVEAFVELDARLGAFGAPARLRRAALQAAKDETRHARMTARLARVHGGEVETPCRRPPARLSFEELARENAVEGCVRETFAALVGLHQAERAADPAIKAAMDRIVRDEVNHAELAWAIHRWASRRLSRAARARIRRAQQVALAELGVTAGAWPPEVVRLAGVPDRPTEMSLLRSFRGGMLAPARRLKARVRTVRAQDAPGGICQ